jgi:hypothetical protein
MNFSTPFSRSVVAHEKKPAPLGFQCYGNKSSAMWNSGMLETFALFRNSSPTIPIAETVHKIHVVLGILHL